MKKLYLLLLLSGIILVGCTKRTYYEDNLDPEYWMSTHERGTVAYVDFYTGNYIVDTRNGYSVIELYGGVAPREYDREYANFSNRGIQTVYNRDAGYFTQVRIIDTWLSWSDAMYLLDDISQ